MSYLLYIGKVSDALMRDAVLALGKLKRFNARYLRGQGDLQEVCFWGKASVSCIFAHMDAVAYAMRTVVVLFREPEELSNREIAKLSERRYDNLTDSLTYQESRLNTTDSFKLGAKYFCDLFGIGFELATGDERWKGLLDLARARHRYTHPKVIEDLYALEMFGLLESSVAWYFSEMKRILEWCGAGVDLSGIHGGAPASAPPLKPKRIESVRLFTPEEMKQEVESVGGRTLLTYVIQFFQRLRYDGSRALKLRKRLGLKKSAKGRFAARLVLRSECSEIEAVSSAVSFLLRSAKMRGEVAYADDEMEAKPGVPPSVGHLISAVNLWSRLVGTGRLLEVGVEAASELEEAWKKRDRLNHPKLVRDLEIGPTEGLRYSLALNKVLAKAFECIEVDPAKWEAAYLRGVATQSPEGS